MSSDGHWLLEKRVRHPHFGPGIIRFVRYGGIHSYVNFHNGLGLWVRTGDLEIENPEPVASPSPPIALRNTDKKRAMQMLEAFKLGIVPTDDVPHFTFGRDSQLQAVRTALDELSQGGTFLLIEGPYGSGKTHMHTYIESLALQQGFAVARTELDHSEVTPYKPKRIYRSLMQNLKWPMPEGAIGTLDHLLERIFNKTLSFPEDHYYFKALIHTLKQPDIPPEKLALLKTWLSGELYDRSDLSSQHFPNLPLLYDHSTAADHMAYLLSGWAHILRNAGIPGLLLVFDEAETAFHAPYQIERQRGMNTLKGLIQVSMNRPGIQQLKKLSLNHKNNAYVDEDGLVHSGIKPLPYAYHTPSYLGLVLTITPSMQPWYRELLEWIPVSRRVVLWPFVTADFEKLTQYLIQLFNIVFPDCAIPSKDFTRLFRLLKRHTWQGSDPPSPRVFLKAVTELLMLRRAYPDADWYELATEETTPQIYQVK